MMLHEFVTTYRDPIIARSREKLTDRPWALTSESELEHGVPLFLKQLSETLRLETTTSQFSDKAIGVTAVKHGRELRALGFNISQVVHDYGDICQAITEIAAEQKLPITTEEFHTLNRCLTRPSQKRSPSTRASPPNRARPKRSSGPGNWRTKSAMSSRARCSRSIP